MTVDKIDDSQWSSSELSQWLKDLDLTFSILKLLSNSSVTRDDLEKNTESYVLHCFIGGQDGPNFYILYISWLFYITFI